MGLTALVGKLASKHRTLLNYKEREKVVSAGGSRLGHRRPRPEGSECRGERASGAASLRVRELAQQLSQGQALQAGAGAVCSGKSEVAGVTGTDSKILSALRAAARALPLVRRETAGKYLPGVLLGHSVVCIGGLKRSQSRGRSPLGA